MHTPLTAPVAGLYPILDQEILARARLTPPAVAPALGRLAIRQVQLRAKGSGRAQYLFAASWYAALREHAPGVRILINDRADIALALGADGVHVGQDDLPAAACRALLGEHRLVGLSTHSVAELRAAPAAGADHAGFGPVFPTTTKADAKGVQGLARLAEACAASPLPVVAIGGIGVERVAAIRAAGAAGAALISGLWLGPWEENLKRAVAAWGAL